MPQDRNEVIEALKRGALNSAAQYVTVRREDLLLALGVEASRANAGDASSATGKDQTDKR